jgi:hypothetical protein
MRLREKTRISTTIMKSALFIALLLVVAAAAMAVRAAHLQPKAHPAGQTLSKFVRNGTGLNGIWSDCSKSEYNNYY